MADTFSGAADLGTLSTFPVTASIDPTGYTREAGEPAPFGSTAGTAWIKFQVSSNRTLYISTEGSAGDTVLGVYVANNPLIPAVNDLSAVATNHGSAADGQSKVSFAAVTGTVYYIQVGSFTSTLPNLYRVALYDAESSYVRMAAEVAEVVIDRAPPVRMAAEVAEVVIDRGPPIRMAAEVAEVVIDRGPPIRMAAIVTEVIIGRAGTKPWWGPEGMGL